MTLVREVRRTSKQRCRLCGQYGERNGKRVAVFVRASIIVRNRLVAMTVQRYAALHTSSLQM